MVTTSVQAIFQDAVRSVSTHKKNVAALLKLQKQQHAKDFRAAFEDCVLRIVTAAKGNAEAERAVKFINAYLESLLVASKELKDLDTLVSQMLLPLALEGTDAALKAVRFRSCQILTAVLNNLDEISETQFVDAKDALMKRLRDKEPSVRAHAAIGLCRLQECSEETDSEQIRSRLAVLLQHDPSAEVRKTVLWNLPISHDTIEPIVERSRDIEASVRKLLYVRLGLEPEILTAMSSDVRNQLVIQGLEDREASVRAACTKMLCDGWIKSVGGVGRFIESLDIRNSPEAASAFLLALFRHDSTMRFVYNDLVAVLEHYMNLAMADTDETQKVDHEYVLQELLALCLHLDLCDEVGRRNLEAFLRAVLVETDLPATGITYVARIGLRVADSHSSYISHLPTLMASIRENHGLSAEPAVSPETLDEPQPWQVEESVAMLKCLETFHCVLQLLNFNIGDTGAIYSLLEKYVFPCLSADIPAISEMALQCTTISFSGWSLTIPTSILTSLFAIFGVSAAIFPSIAITVTVTFTFAITITITITLFTADTVLVAIFAGYIFFTIFATIFVPVFLTLAAVSLAVRES
eukprot:jgi/Hompol1/6937/HPOL_001692-RA